MPINGNNTLSRKFIFNHFVDLLPLLVDGVILVCFRFLVTFLNLKLSLKLLKEVRLRNEMLLPLKFFARLQGGDERSFLINNWIIFKNLNLPWN